MKKGKPRLTYRKTDIDIALIGICTRVPDTDLKVISWRSKTFYLATDSDLAQWVEGSFVYFFPDKSHAFDVTPLPNQTKLYAISDEFRA